MSRWRVEVAYQTKRGNFVAGMEIEAEDEDAAEAARDRAIFKVLHRRPARRLVYSVVERAAAQVQAGPAAP